jgi:hypothetical protein
MESLKHLDLKNNLIVKINFFQFLKNTELKSLNLENNKIVKLGKRNLFGKQICFKYLFIMFIF